MKKSIYGERDYAFSQLMLTLRTAMGLTQENLAQHLGVSRRAVGTWESGLNYPAIIHLKQIIALGIKLQAFARGREIEEVHTLWHAARQKVLLDQTWLAELLSQEQVPQSIEEPVIPAPPSVPPAGGGPRVDWEDAHTITSFYGRERELQLLTTWVVEERCRVVSVLGLGGVGKSALATKVIHQVAEHFEVVIWRSLHDAPTYEALLDDCLQVLAPQALQSASASLENRQNHLLECLRNHRVLLVYDNLEEVLAEGEDTGHMCPGYEGFAYMLRRIAGTKHQSCLLLTSREKPRELEPLEGRHHTLVRTLHLAGLGTEACQRLLADKEVAGTTAEQIRLIETYAGNPLALKIVAQAIRELFGGQIAPFLAQGQIVFGGVRRLLEEQFARLSAIEQTVLLWLAILREPVSLPKLLAVLSTPMAHATVLDAVEALRRRSLIEPGQRPGSFTLQTKVLEYATARLIAEMASEIGQGRLSRLVEHGLALAGVREYVRQIQIRLIVLPLLAQVRRMYPEQAALEDHLLGLLDRLRARAADAQGYGPANVLALLGEQHGHLRGLDLSKLSLRRMHLQGVEMQDTTLAGARLQDCTWASTFSAIWAVATSRSGQYWAAGSRQGEVWVWKKAGQILHLAWQAHTDIIRTLSFSPDGCRLASGSDDGTIKLWDVESGALLWSGEHTNRVSAVAFAPDASLLASGGIDATIRLWDSHSGALIATLQHPDEVAALAWSPSERLLASGGSEGEIRLWKIGQSGSASCVAVLAGHSSWVFALAFAPDGSRLASGSWDRTVKLWEMQSGYMSQTLVGHTNRVHTVAWSPDGRTVASAGFDRTIWLWDSESGRSRMVLSHGLIGVVFDLTFTPRSHHLLSGNADGTLRVWDVENGQCVNILQGYGISLSDVAWSPDGTKLASAGSDMLVTIWDAAGLASPRLLCGHCGPVEKVAWSPDGRWLASCGWDNAIYLWDAITGARGRSIKNADDLFSDMAWSPDGSRLASGSYWRGVQMWEVATGSCCWITSEQRARAHRVVWSRDRKKLASGGDDGIVSLWDASDGTLLKRLKGHQGRVNDVAWSPDGTLLASSASSQGEKDSGKVFVWDIQRGERVHTLAGHSGMVSSVTWEPSGTVLVSGDSDGMLRWWDIEHEECIRVRRAHQGTVQRLQVSPDGSKLASCGDDGAITLWDLHSGEHLRTLRRDRPYERLDISGVKGLTQIQKASLCALGAVENWSEPILSDVESQFLEICITI